MRRHYDIINDILFPRESSGRSEGESPMMPVEVTEDKERYIVRAEIPGVDKKDIEISLNDDVLTITAEKKKEERDALHTEIVYGKVSRSFRLDNIDEEGAQAEYKDGILIITIPKAKEEIKKIEVK